jgi:hypothetical protein
MVLSELSTYAPIILLVGAVIVLIESVILYFIVKRQKPKRQKYKYALLAAISNSLLGALISVLLVFLNFPGTIVSSIQFVGGIILSIALVKYIYQLDTEKSVFIGLIWWLITSLIGVLIGVLIAMTFLFSMGVFT